MITHLLLSRLSLVRESVHLTSCRRLRYVPNLRDPNARESRASKSKPDEHDQRRKDSGNCAVEAEDFRVVAGRETQKGIRFDEPSGDGSKRISHKARKGRVREAGSQSGEQAAFRLRPMNQCDQVGGEVAPCGPPQALRSY